MDVVEALQTAERSTESCDDVYLCRALKTLSARVKELEVYEQNWKRMRKLGWEAYCWEEVCKSHEADQRKEGGA